MPPACQPGGLVPRQACETFTRKRDACATLFVLTPLLTKRELFASRVSTDRQGLFVTTVVACWLISSCALIFWICAACSLTCAARACVSFCCRATLAFSWVIVACNWAILRFSDLLSMACRCAPRGIGTAIFFP